MYFVENDFDVAIVGGGIAGLSAALFLARARVKVCVINDAGAAVFTGQSFNFLTNDGKTKAEILGRAQADVDRYEAVARIEDRVTWVEKDALSYHLTLAGHPEISVARLVFSMGQALPEDGFGIEGFLSNYGKSIFTCPYCHGHELIGRDVLLIGTNEQDASFAQLLTNWVDRVDYVSHDGPSAREFLPGYDNGTAVDGRVVRIGGTADRTGVTLEDGRSFETDAVFVSDIPGETSWPIIDALGIERGYHPVTGKVVYKTDMAGRTDLGDVFVIGDARTGFSTLTGAANEGQIAGFMLASDIIGERTKPAAEMKLAI